MVSPAPSRASSPTFDLPPLCAISFPASPLCLQPKPIPTTVAWPHSPPALALWTLGPDYDLSTHVADIEKKLQLRG
jgi:hypothetical protein